MISVWIVDTVFGRIVLHKYILLQLQNIIIRRSGRCILCHDYVGSKIVKPCVFQIPICEKIPVNRNDLNGGEIGVESLVRNVNKDVGDSLCTDNIILEKVNCNAVVKVIDPRFKDNRVNAEIEIFT